MKYRLIVKNSSVEKILSRMMYSSIRDFIEGTALFTQEDGTVCVELNIQFTPNSNEKLFFETFLKESSSIKIWERLS